MTPSDYAAALRRLARDVRAWNKRALASVESGLARRARQLRDPARVDDAAASLEADLAAGKPLGRAAARARDACAAWIGQHPARPDEHFAAEIFERAGRLAAWAVRRDAPPLTPNQRFVLEAVAASRASRGRDPTQREVAEALGVTPARVSQLMRRLRERGDLDGPAPLEDR